MDSRANRVWKAARRSSPAVSGTSIGWAFVVPPRAVGADPLSVGRRKPVPGDELHQAIDIHEQDRTAVAVRADAKRLHRTVIDLFRGGGVGNRRSELGECRQSAGVANLLGKIVGGDDCGWFSQKVQATTGNLEVQRTVGNNAPGSARSAVRQGQLLDPRAQVPCIDRVDEAGRRDADQIRGVIETQQFDRVRVGTHDEAFDDDEDCAG